MERIAQAAVSATASPQSITRFYFLRNSWEATMRGNFTSLRQSIVLNPSLARDEGVASLHGLNRDYRTRHSRPAELPRLYEELVAGVEEVGWWKGSPLQLLSCSDDEVPVISGVVEGVLARVVAWPDRPGVRAYSLITKWLHFLLPDTFAIFDWQVAASIQSWSNLAQAALPARDARRLQYTASVIGFGDGRGYIGILRFYRELWRSVRDGTLGAALQMAANEMQAIVRTVPGGESGTVNVIDVLDKLLWQAGGSPRVLGLE